MAGVRAEFGPTLPELLGARRWRFVWPVAVVAAIALLAVVLVARGASDRADIVLRGRGALEFTFVYQRPLRQAGPVTVEQRAGSVFVQSMSVARMTLPAYHGDSAGTLPVVADRLEDQLAAKRPGFEVVSEGRARIKNNPGYTISWTATLGKRRLFGREYLLVPDDEPHPRVAARLELLSTYKGGVSTSDDIGRLGPLKHALHSFSFGAER